MYSSTNPFEDTLDKTFQWSFPRCAMSSALGYSKTLENPRWVTRTRSKNRSVARQSSKHRPVRLNRSKNLSKNRSVRLNSSENLSKNRSVRLTARKNVQKNLFGTAKLVRDGNKFCFYSPGLGDRGKSQYIYIYIHITNPRIRLIKPTD